MLKIGLTGGIGSGKTAASNHFAQLGVSVIDTDLIARELVAPGQPALAEIEAMFGPEILDTAGRLNRAALRARVFDDARARSGLEGILHPRIRETMLARGAATDAPYVVFVIPLLFETGQQTLVDRALVIDVSEPVQRERVAARDGLRPEDVDGILKAQFKRDQRLRLADDVIVNDGTLNDLKQAVESQHERYLAMATDIAG